MLRKSEFFLHNILKHFFSILLIKGRKSVNHFIQQSAHSIKIDSPIMSQFLYHLRRHVPKIPIKNTLNFHKKNKRVHPSPGIYWARNLRFSNSLLNPEARFQVSNPGKRFYCGEGSSLPSRFTGNRDENQIQREFSLVLNEWRNLLLDRIPLRKLNSFARIL